MPVLDLIERVEHPLVPRADDADLGVGEHRVDVAGEQLADVRQALVDVGRLAPIRRESDTVGS